MKKFQLISSWLSAENSLLVEIYLRSLFFIWFRDSSQPIGATVSERARALSSVLSSAARHLPVDSAQLGFSWDSVRPTWTPSWNRPRPVEKFYSLEKFFKISGKVYKTFLKWGGKVNNHHNIQKREVSLFLYVFYPVDPSFCRINPTNPNPQKLVSTGILLYKKSHHENHENKMHAG